MHIRQLVDPVRQRQRRYDTMVSLLHLGDDETVLSVGCGEGNSFEKFNRTNPVTGIDLFETSRLPNDPRFQYVQRTSDEFPFGNGQFDVAVCIGVLEHITDPDVLAATCREIRRVGRRYLVLVPHYWTLVEPHYGFPFFQHLPVRVQAKMTRALGLRHAPGHAAHEYEVLNYFPTRMWLSYFPSAHHRTYWHVGPMITNLIMLGNGAGTGDGETYSSC
jgi:SAM-dependent methyltransferase